MRRIFPTVALQAEDIPPPGTRVGASRFGTFDGYAAAGSQEAMTDIMRRAKAHGLASLSLLELRIEHFRAQRAQRHGGGPYGDDDPWDRHMEAIRVEMRARLASSRPSLGVWTGDITRLSVDGIVNAANETLLGGGGVDGAIHRAAGPDLLDACRAIPELRLGVRCPTGQARITPGFLLPADHVIHAVGPRWKGGRAEEGNLLASTYRAIVELATEHQLDVVAIPAISTGIFGFPAQRAARIAVDTLRAWQTQHDAPQRIVLVGYDDEASATLRSVLAR